MHQKTEGIVDRRGDDNILALAPQLTIAKKKKSKCFSMFHIHPMRKTWQNPWPFLSSSKVFQNGTMLVVVALFV